MILTPIVASQFRSDGGAMFGLVPKPIWSRLIAPDERNAIPQNANCLLVELDDGRRGLIDTGCGDASLLDDKTRAHSGLGPGWPLLAALDANGLSVDDIAFVIFTHLHWDHVGGGSRVVNGRRTLTFPNAQYFVHGQEWQDACSDDPLLHKSYVPETIEAFEDAEALRFFNDPERELFPGLRVVQTGGHTAGHCMVVFEEAKLNVPSLPPGLREAQRFIYPADVCPTQHHLRLVFQTAYDTFPLATRAWKQKWLRQMATNNDVLLFDHDPTAVGAMLTINERDQVVVASAIPISEQPSP